MYTEIKVNISSSEKNDNGAILGKLGSVLSRHGMGPVFIIGSWQSGDFCHIYAAAVRHFTIDSETPFGMLLLVEEKANIEFLLSDIRFAMGAVFKRDGCFTLFVTEPISKNRAIAGMGQLMKADNAREPYDATFWAEEAVKSMTKGQPLTPVWADLVRRESEHHVKAFSEICMFFMDEYVRRFGMSSGREKFVCVWGRTSGQGTLAKGGLGGANPQYDSSPDGNQQLCLNLKHRIPDLKAVFIVGDGFNDATRRLPFVFDLGAFWTRYKPGVGGRFQENGFFDFMTAFYDCDVVHVGMKSGGMDTLGIWGQKVVFIDSVRAPAITKGRVAAWSTATLMPVEISEMPTPLGKAIEIARDERSAQEAALKRGEIEKVTAKGFKTTFGSKKEVAEIGKIVTENNLNDLFSGADLDKIAQAVITMFG